MAVMMPREKWTDERLDDLNKKVDEGFTRVEGQVKDLRSEMNNRFTSIEDRLTSIENRLDGLNRNLIGGLFVLIAAVIGSNAF